MTSNIRKFLGMKIASKTDADRLLDSVFELAFSGFEKHFSHNWIAFPTVSQFFNELSAKKPELSYVSDWYFEKGREFLENIDTQLSEVPDIIAFLEHEKFSVEIDINEGDYTNFLFSFTEVFPIISNYIVDFYKETLNKPPFNAEAKKIPLPGNKSTKITIDSKWSVASMPKSSASTDAELLLLYI